MSRLCLIGGLLAEGSPMAAEDRATLAPLVTCPYPEEVSAVTLANALCNSGHPVGPTTIKDHRASRCACTRTKA